MMKGLIARDGYSQLLLELTGIWPGVDQFHCITGVSTPLKNVMVRKVVETAMQKI